MVKYVAVLLLLAGCAAPIPLPSADTAPDSTTAVTAAPTTTGESLAESVTGCGVERWSVKTGQDAGARTVNLTPQAATVAQLGAIPVPAGRLGDTRVGPTEATIYRITATVTAYKTEADSDVHLALTDSTGHTMIAEIPKPSCIKASPFLTQIATSRAVWQAAHSNSTSYVPVHQQVTITGVGFFDKLHGQRGVAPNGIELHPVLLIALR